jgi:hypothetical protein
MDHCVSYLHWGELSVACKAARKEHSREAPAAKKRRTAASAAAAVEDGESDAWLDAVGSGNVRDQIAVCDQVVRALHQVFVVDATLHFMGKEKFDRLLPVLVGQLEWSYYVRPNAEQYKTFVHALLAPAIVEMAALMGNFVCPLPSFFFSPFFPFLCFVLGSTLTFRLFVLFV